jgi:hypothetical protein
MAIDSTLIHTDYVFLFVGGDCPLILLTFFPFADLAFWHFAYADGDRFHSHPHIVILLQKSILNSVGERGEEVEDVGKCSFEVRSEFFNGIEVRRVGRQENQGTAGHFDGPRSLYALVFFYRDF